MPSLTLRSAAHVESGRSQVAKPRTSMKMHATETTFRMDAPVPRPCPFGGRNVLCPVRAGEPESDPEAGHGEMGAGSGA